MLCSHQDHGNTIQPSQQKILLGLLEGIERCIQTRNELPENSGPETKRYGKIITSENGKVANLQSLIMKELREVESESGKFLEPIEESEFRYALQDNGGPTLATQTVHSKFLISRMENKG